MGIFDKISDIGGGAAKIAAAGARLAGQRDIADQLDRAASNAETAANQVRHGKEQMARAKKNDGE